MTLLAPVLQAFFTERLLRQLHASPHTVRGYCDSFRLLLRFAEGRTGKAPSRLDLADLDAALISAFLDHLEHERHNSARTRNTRMAAIRSFFGYASYREPADAAVIQRVLAIPDKRARKGVVSYLSTAEVGALLAAPDRATWIGRRDHALLATVLQTGMRVSEVTALRRRDVVLGTGAHVRCHGKGRKERCTPLTRHTVEVLAAWLAERGGGDDDAVFPTRRGNALSPDSVGDLVDRHVAVASQHPGWTAKRVTPRTLRHTTAMTLLAAGVETSVIALWLGHEHIRTTQINLHGDLTEAAGSRSDRSAGHAARALPSPGPPHRLPGVAVIIRGRRHDQPSATGLPGPRPG